jgi:uncharacterized membrane protein (TIGR02234 family)
VKDRRGLTTACLLCLLGAFVVLVAAGRSWALVEVAAGPLAEARTDAHTGTDVVPGVSALGLVGLAGVVALAATRRTGRTLVGVVLLATGAGVLAAVVSALRTTAAELAGQTGADAVDVTAWPFVTAAGGLLLLLAGLLTVARGRSWPALGQRYDAPAGAAPQEPTEKGLWEALDRGEDPTANLGTLAGPPADREADRT